MPDLSLGEVINGLVEASNTRLNTALPGIIVGVKNASGTLLDVQPAVNMLAETGETLPRSVILNVPAVMPQSSTGGLQFELNVGDPILLVFSQRGLEVWKSGDGKPASPNTMRMFDSRDCFAIPCVFPQATTPTQTGKHTYPHSSSDVVLVHNIGKANEVEIRLKKSGDVVINTTGKVTVNSTETEVNSDTAVVNAVTTVNGLTTINGNTTINGTLNVSTSVTTPTVVATTSLTVQDQEMFEHAHDGVEPGTGTSGGPV
jgi:Phage protein Gp138 N-terminal domain